MEMTLGDFDETYDAERLRRQQLRLEFQEAQLRLEHFAHPQDDFQEVDPEDAALDLQIRNYRQLAKLNQYMALG
ncbi:hypothetical protein JST97_12425 [bacterium]|nr:hypothetical protein [bacterium]